jgi:hypothetical protein
MLLSCTLALVVGCTSTSEKDDTSADTADAEAGDAPTTGPGGGSGDGSATEDDVSPRITDGYAIYDDTDGLGIILVFAVTVDDPDDDLARGTFLLGLDDDPPFSFPIESEDISYTNDRVSLTLSNVEPVSHQVEMRVIDAAGHASNLWEGQTEWSRR